MQGLLRPPSRGEEEEEELTPWLNTATPRLMGSPLLSSNGWKPQKRCL